VGLKHAMSGPEKPTPSRDPRIVKHMRALGAAAEARDVEKFREALRAIRDDNALTPPQRGAILKTIAQEQAAGFHTIVTGQPFGTS
jgi:hypothetical protein